MNYNAPILITGCPRSGTSMVAGVFNICGVFKGMVDRMNENVPIREVHIKNYLRKIGFDANGIYPIAENYPMGYCPEYWGEEFHIEMQKQGNNGTWFYKDNRITILWQLFNAAFPNAVWVIVRRNKNDILESCRKTGSMRTFNSVDVCNELQIKTQEEGWSWVEGQYVNRFTQIKKNARNVFEVWPEKFMDNNYSEIKNVLSFCNLEWKEEEVRNYIEPKIFRRTTI
jgi:hypothetical protein